MSGIGDCIAYLVGHVELCNHLLKSFIGGTGLISQVNIKSKISWQILNMRDRSIHLVFHVVHICHITYITIDKKIDGGVSMGPLLTHPLAAVPSILTLR